MDAGGQLYSRTPWTQPDLFWRSSSSPTAMERVQHKLPHAWPALLSGLCAAVELGLGLPSSHLFLRQLVSMWALGGSRASCPQSKCGLCMCWATSGSVCFYHPGVHHHVALPIPTLNLDLNQGPLQSMRAAALISVGGGSSPKSPYLHSYTAVAA